MKKELFTAFYEVETETRVFHEGNPQELDWDENEFNMEVLNCLATFLGLKIACTFKDTRLKERALEVAIDTLKYTIEEGKDAII